MNMRIRSSLLAGALAATALAAGPVAASLPKGAEAPPVMTTGAMAGKAFSFDLAKALKSGPVVLYFFPKAFTQGCTLEARAFAEAMPDFKAAGAQVVGMSADDIETLKKFSTEECRNAFPVAQATPATIRAYDVALDMKNVSGLMSDRTSYVIAPDGRIAMVHSDSDWREHVSRTLEAVRALDR
ncbi:peroxiredoxin [Croceicoccus sp. Ery5]|uniref:peroxiredoxin n=1 Tax=Croceicoccus sp. Ery5 TaxID=1703340 RepID=UPI001E61BDF1|nr:peroxiredoxin [Croceicoccus sp. Ery5]